MNYIITGLVTLAITVGGLVGFKYNHQYSNPLGSFSDPFISIQLATAPANGNCLTTDGTNNSWSSSCGSGGGGSGGGTWATTTSLHAGRLINSPLNATDIVVIGSTATTTAKFYFDPNTLTFSLTGNGTTTGVFNAGINVTAPFFNATGTVPSLFPYASTTAISIGLQFISSFGNGLSVSGTTGVVTATLGTTVDLTTEVTGVLPVANGGTASTSPQPAGVILGNYLGTGYMALATSSLGITTNNVAEGGGITYYTAERYQDNFGSSFIQNGTLITWTYNDVGNAITANVALANLTATDNTLTFSGTYDGSTARTIGLNLGNANVWTALQSFTNANAILATGSTTLQNFTATNSTTTNATSTTLFATIASTTQLTIGNISGVLKATSGLVSIGTDGTDYSLITALSCSAGQHLNSAAANGDFTCSADTGSGGGSGGGTWSTTTSQVSGQFINYPNNNTDIVTVGNTATTTAKYWFDPNSLKYYLSGTGTSTGAFTSFNTITAPNFIATSTSNSTGTSTFSGSVRIGSGLYGDQFPPTGFFNTSGNPQAMIANNLDEAVTLLTVGNGSTGAFSNGCINWANGRTSFEGGVAATYNSGICYSGPNWGAYPGQQANGLAIYNSDGGIVTGALSTNYASSSISWAVGPGFSAANYDLILQNLNPTPYPNSSGYANLGLGTTTSVARFAITSSSTNPIPYILIASSTNATNSTVGTVAQGIVFTILNNANLGIATTTPGNRLGVMGSAVIADYVNASRFIATSSVASIFPYASTTALTVSGQGYLGNLLVNGSSTLQNFTGSNATTTNATSTTLSASASLCLASDCRNAWPSAGGGAFPFTVTTNFNQTVSATSTALWLQGSILSLMASSSAVIDGNVNFGAVGASGFTYASTTASSTISHLEAGSLVSDFDPGIFNIFDIRGFSAAANTLTSGCLNMGSSTPNLCISGLADGSGGFKNQRVGIGSTTPGIGTLVIKSMISATSTITFDTPGCFNWPSPDGTKYRVYMSNAGAITTEAGYCQGN